MRSAAATLPRWPPSTPAPTTSGACCGRRSCCGAREAHAAGRARRAGVQGGRGRGGPRRRRPAGGRPGCPVVTDGELRRDSFQSEFTAAIDGVEGVSLDAWLWGDWHSERARRQAVERPAEMAVTAPLARRRSLAAEEFAFLRAITDRVAKVTLPSPQPVRQPVDAGALARRLPALRRLHGRRGRRSCVDEVRELAGSGCRYVQLDAPALPAAGRPDLARVLRGARLDASTAGCPTGSSSTTRSSTRRRRSPSASTSARATRTAAGWWPAATSDDRRADLRRHPRPPAAARVRRRALGLLRAAAPRARRQARRARARDDEVAAARDRGRARGAHPRRRRASSASTASRSAPSAASRPRSSATP